MMAMLDVMIDLETMGTQPDAAIVAIGAVEFDAQAGVLGGSRYWRVDLASSVAGGGTIDPGTVLWWMQQEDDARCEVWSMLRVTLLKALDELAAWLGDRPDTNRLCVWGNGAAFDNVILRGAYTRLGRVAPWAWRNDRCYRTLCKLLPHVDGPPRESMDHHAQSDALHQARHAIMLLSQVRNPWAGVRP